MDRDGQTLDFMLSAKRDTAEAKKSFANALYHNGIATRISVKIDLARSKYLNNIVEQDHLFIKRVTRPMLGFKSFISAAATLTGIEVANMIRKGQFGSLTIGFLQFAELSK